MDKIIISDIFGNKLNNSIDQLFIIVESPYILQKITDRTLYHDSIWKINYGYYDRLTAIANKYGPVGDLWFPNEEVRNKILLVHKKISTHPIDFIKIDTYMDTNIWKPIPPPGFQYLGLVYSKMKPKLDSIFVVNQNYVIDYDCKTQIRGRNTYMNEYNLLSNLIISKKTINTKKLSTKKEWVPQIGKKVKLIQSETPWYDMPTARAIQSRIEGAKIGTLPSHPTHPLPKINNTNPNEAISNTENFARPVQYNKNSINLNYIVSLLIFLILIITIVHMSL